MSVQIDKLTADKAVLILNKEEGHFCDMKAKEIAPSKLSCTLSAMANADGGEIFIGIKQHNNNFVWDGFPTQEAANCHISLIDQLFPIGNVTKCTFLSCDAYSGLVLQVEVEKAADVRNASDGIAYLRRGAQNLKQSSPEQVLRIKLNKGIISHEDNTIQADINEIANSVSIIDFMLSVIPSAEPEAWLRKQRLVINEMPVVAGVVLFSDEPQTILPKAAIKIYRYKTRDAVGTRATLAFDPLGIEGNAYFQIFTAVDKVKEIIEKIPLPGKQGFETAIYPTEAIHEIVTNAVIHRDYSINDDIHIRIFDNRIEVQSPGTLPGHVTVENILDERVARNPKIVRLLNKHRNPPNKDVGEGLNTAFEAMRSLKLKDPIIEQRENCVLVTLRHEKLGTPENLIVDYLRTHAEINNSIARSICVIGSENTVKRIFQKMITSGLIERVPDRPLNKTGYKKGPNFPSL